MYMDEMAWMSEGICSSIGPQLFYADPSDANSGTIARKVCDSCPVVDECAEHGIKHERFGIWGGLTPQQRSAIRRERNITCQDPSIFWWVNV